MKRLFLIAFLSLILGCKTYYLSPCVVGRVEHQDRALKDVSIQFIHESGVLSMKDGTFTIPANTERFVTSPNLREIREMNSPLIIFQKEGFRTDTIDIRKYDYNSSIYSIDTVNIGKIKLMLSND